MAESRYLKDRICRLTNRCTGETGKKTEIQPNHADRLRLQLAALDTAQTIEDMEVPGYRLHPLKGRMKGRWSIWVSGNWRLTFEFVDGNVHMLDYEDYH